ncbi:MAG: hypothetical protein ABW051_10955 [Burkholderiaceae bacterium]
MTDNELDVAYTALCEALGEVGQERAPLLLSMLALSLMSRFPSAAEVLPLIATAKAQSLDETPHG